MWSLLVLGNLQYTIYNWSCFLTLSLFGSDGALKSITNKNVVLALGLGKVAVVSRCVATLSSFIEQDAVCHFGCPRHISITARRPPVLGRLGQQPGHRNSRALKECST